MSENEVDHPFDYLEGFRCISLTTYRKNGTGKATPVDFARKGDKLYVATPIKSYKVKRIRWNENAELAPCTFRGKLKGPKTKVKVRLLPKEEEQIAIDTLEPLYQGLRWKILFALMKLAFWYNPGEEVHLEIRAAED